MMLIRKSEATMTKSITLHEGLMRGLGVWRTGIGLLGSQPVEKAHFAMVRLWILLVDAWESEQQLGHIS